MNLLDSLRARPTVADRFTLPDLQDMVYGFAGNQYFVKQTQPDSGKYEPIGSDFTSYVQQAYKANGIVFACILTRLLILSEARFKYRRLASGRPGGLFGDPSLTLLERPWLNGTTGDLIGRMEQDSSLAGNCYLWRDGGRIRRLRPDWVSIILGSQMDAQHPADAADTELVGYLYTPGGPKPSGKPMTLMPDEVAHYAPIPDPEATYRGMSWLTPVLREIEGDGQATQHKLAFFRNASTPNMAVVVDKAVTPAQLKEFKEVMDGEHRGVWNAYKTLYLGGGADVKTIGADFQQNDFRAVQGAGETRIAAASGVAPIIVGLSEGLASATYSNYGQARRRVADGLLRPLWRNMAGSLAHLVPVPSDAELWYDERDVAFLREDMGDQATINQTNAQSIRQLVEAGYTPDTAVSAVMAGDMSLLKHTGLYSVQLQEPGSKLLPGPTVDGGDSNNPVGKDAKQPPIVEASPKAAPLPKRDEPTETHIHILNEIHERNVTVSPPNVHVAAPQVHVDPQITVEPAEANVEVHVDRGRTVKRIERGPDGSTRVVEEPA